ncbi:apoptosis-associated speck-like protein containing a CARD isoform X2 [Hypomesus transpacificus]|uniref:apoptosis-associated speck-like protein containing a CARD isoform X2 n=1 Tax=Hypomesus transpacificus TaxID=137520 RepID=UPI001F07228F|nr:apoptosis-associated speck-like protein containing a CARD isoform X2 [Hypomesus transpacificus]
MPPKTVKKILNDVLGDLQSKNFKKFKNYLSDRDQEPRIPVSVIENADEMDIVDALVRTYTEKKAISVAIEVLRDINCLDLAEKLENYMKGRHLVDVHRAALIQRVTSVGVILDDLLGQEVLSDEKYNEVTAEKTRQDKMRKLYDVISAASSEGKDVFYKSLEKHEKFLMKDLIG